MPNLLNFQINNTLEAKPCCSHKQLLPLSVAIQPPFHSGCISTSIGASLNTSLLRKTWWLQLQKHLTKILITVLFTFSITTIKAQTIDTVFTTQNSGISYNIVNAVNIDLTNRLFIGTEYGLTIYENNTWQILREAESELPENSIRSLHTDAHNKIWLGGFSTNPSVMQNDSIMQFPIPEELSKQIKDILVVQHNEEELLYLATASGLGIYNFSNKNWQIINLNSAYIESPNFTSLAYSTEVGLCAGTLNGGLVIVRNNGQVETYFGEGIIPDNTILDVAIDKNNLVWLASPAGGIITFKDGNFESITPFNSNIHSEFISCLWVVNSKNIWFGTNAKGIGHLEDGNFSHFDTYNSKLLNNKINNIHLQKDSILWVATDNGLAKLCIYNKMLTTASFSVVSNLVFPNPASNKINILQKHYDEALMYDNNGKVVFQSNSPIQQIEVSNFNPGIYYIAVKFNNKISVNKLSIF